MAAPKGNIVPSGTAVVAGRNTRHRIRALIDEALAGVTGDAPVRHASGATLIERIQLALLEAPVATLAALEKLLPPDPDETKAASGGINIGALYLQAVQQAQPVVIEHEAQASGYIAGTDQAKPLIAHNEW